MADETKVGHGFVACTAEPGQRCLTKRGPAFCHHESEAGTYDCELPRSAHPAEERKEPSLADRWFCEELPGGGRIEGYAHVTAAPAQVPGTECDSTPAGNTEQASEEERMIGGRNRVAWQSWVLHMQQATWRFDRNDAEDVAALVDAAFRIRSEGGGEKGCEVGRSGHWLGHYGPGGEIQCRYCGRTPAGILRGQSAPSGEKGWQPIETKEEDE